MRVIKTFFSILLTLVILVVVGVFVAREVLLHIAVFQIKNAVGQMETLYNRGEYIQNCLSMGAEMIGNIEPYHMQLRFLDDQSYVTEVVCDGLENSPITVLQKELPLFVQKLPGSSGIVWSTDYSGMRLKFLGRTAEIYLEEDEIVSNMKITDEELDSGPMAACSAYGFSCCDINQEKGLGDQLIGVKDCSESCFEACSFSPVVLSFASRPFFDQTTRKLNIKSGEMISFSYTISSSQQASFEGQIEEEDDRLTQLIKNIDKLLDKNKKYQTEGDQIQIIIDFGDGKQKNSFDLNGMVDHTYTCTTGKCEYLAKVNAVNMVNSARSADNLINKIKIVVNR